MAVTTLSDGPIYPVVILGKWSFLYDKLIYSLSLYKTTVVESKIAEKKIAQKLLGYFVLHIKSQ